MDDQLEKLKKLRKQVRKYEDTIRYYEKLFLEDGEISTWEQEQLDNINQTLKKINKQINHKEKELL
jgi:dsDNA-specific endonuclease/ATPase MutS2